MIPTPFLKTDGTAGKTYEKISKQIFSSFAFLSLDP